MRKLWILFFALVMLSCGEETDVPQQPENLIGLDSFKVIMVDVQLLEATFNQKFFREDDPNEKLPEFYGQIFEKHQITEKAFEDSYEFYANQPKVMMEVYEYIINDLSQREEKINSIKDEIRKTDNSAPQSGQ